MRIIALLLVVIGAVLAGGAIYYGQQYIGLLQANAARPVPAPENVQVMVASRRLDYGHRITPANVGRTLRWVEWPAHAVPDGAFQNLEELLGDSKDETRVVLRTIEPGELLLASKISTLGGSARVATRVSEGKRAFAIPIDAVSGVAGLITPGDRVDILLIRTIGRQLTTSAVLQNILVIAVDQVSDTASDRARLANTVTVEVTPAEAQTLTLAQGVGRLTLTLRGMEGPEQEDMGPVNVQDLPDQPLQQQAPLLEDPAVRVRVRKGGQLEEVEVE